MPTFSATTEGRNSLHLQEMVEEFANQLWLPAHLTPEQASAVVLDQFRRTVESELQMIEITVQE